MIRQTRHIIYNVCLLLMVMLMATSCEMRHIDKGLPGVDIDDDEALILTIDVDWSEMDEMPTGMTLLFYPSDGSAPYIRVTNSVTRYVITLPYDDYSVIVFNQTENEFSFLKFVGLQSYDTAAAEALIENDGRGRIERLFSMPSQLNGTRARSTQATLKPGSIGSAGSRNVTTNATRARSTQATLKPKSNIGRMNISVRVQGLSAESANPVTAVNGALSGLADAYFMGLGHQSEFSLTQELEDWAINYAPTVDEIGNITTSFGTFGISRGVTRNSRAANDTNGSTSLTYTEEMPEDDYRNILYLNFRLSDGTYVPYRFDVTNRIRKETDGEGEIEVTITLDLDIGVKMPGVDDGLDDPLVLPESGMPYEEGGVSVKQWSDSIETVLPLK